MFINAFRLIVIVSSIAVLGACAAPVIEGTAGFASFASRCADPDVIRCFGFESSELATRGGAIHWSHSTKPTGVFVNGKTPSANLNGRVELASDQFASGASSLKFFMPSNSGASHSGQFYANFSDDYSVQFGEGDEFFIQWRQRFSAEFLRNRYEPFNSWKQAIIGEGSRPDFHSRSCTQLELVLYHKGGGPAMYHSCRGKDGRSEGLVQNKTVSYVPDEWMTFQIRVKVGTWYKNDKRYNKDSLIELWVAREGQSSQLVLSQNYDLANTRQDARYGKVWLLPYLTGKKSSQEHPDAYTWYDELVISTTRIADPKPE